MLRASISILRAWPVSPSTQSANPVRRGREKWFFLSGHALRAFKKVVSDFNGRFHNMATHIRMDGHPYQAVFPKNLKRRDPAFACPGLLLAAPAGAIR